MPLLYSSIGCLLGAKDSTGAGGLLGIDLESGLGLGLYGATWWAFLVSVGGLFCFVLFVCFFFF